MRLKNTWHEIREHSFIQNHSRSFRFTDPWQCFFSSVHLTHFLQGSGQDWNGHSKSLVLCSVTHFCVFEVCVWIIVQLEDPNMAHYKISNRVRHLLIFFICWYLIESILPCVQTRCPGPPAEIFAHNIKNTAIYLTHLTLHQTDLECLLLKSSFFSFIWS